MGGISDDSAVLPSETCLRSGSARIQTVRKQSNMRMVLSVLFCCSFLSTFFPRVYLNSSPGRNDSAAKRNKWSLCSVIAGWQGDAVLALLAGPGLSTHHVFTQRLHLVCVSGAHSYKYKGESIRQGRVYITQVAHVSALTHSSFDE